MTLAKVAIVGAGVMGEGMINSLIKSGANPNEIVIKDKRSERVQELKEVYGVNSGNVGDVNTILLAVKPQDFEVCIEDLKVDIQSSILLVSIMAGVRCSRIESAIGNNARVIRVMPNTPMLLGEGMSVIAQGRTSTKEDLDWVNRLFSNSGKTLVVDEKLMDAVTAVSGSGPAYFYGFVEAMIASAVKLGLAKQDANLLVNQTIIGVAKMVRESGKDAATLRREVTSPNGTTAAALNSFDASGWEDIVYRAMRAAMDRSKELSN